MIEWLVPALLVLNLVLFVLLYLRPGDKARQQRESLGGGTMVGAALHVIAARWCLNRGQRALAG
jgi:hypothetical protein